MSDYYGIVSLDKKELLYIEKSIDNLFEDIYQGRMLVAMFLIRAKRMFQHGQYEKWYTDKFGSRLPLKTAQAWVRVCKTIMSDKKIDIEREHAKDLNKHYPWSFLMLICQKRFPEEARGIILHFPDDCDKDTEWHYRRAIEHTDLSVIKNAYKKYLREEMTEDEFIALVRKQHELGKQIQDGKEEAIERQKMQTEVDKLERMLQNFGMNAVKCKKFYNNIQHTNPLVEDKLKFFLQIIDSATKSLDKIRQDIVQRRIEEGQIPEN